MRGGAPFVTYGPHVAGYGGDRAIAVFSQDDSFLERVYANRYNGTTWLGATPIDASTGEPAQASRIAADSNGNAIAIFRQQLGGVWRIYANYYTAHAPTPTPTPQAEIVLNGTTFSTGQPFTATFRLNRSVEQPFTAYAVVVLPDGFMLDALTLGPEIKPVASNVPRLDAPFTHPLMSLNIPAGAPLGNYQVMAGFFTPGKPISGPQDAFLLATGPFTIQ